MTTKVEKTITVDVPVTTAYNQWTQFEDFPHFMGGIQQVEQLDDQRLHWVAQIGGVKREWYATILEQRQDEKVAWAATEGATNAGAVYFTSTGTGQTLVRLELEFEPEGAVEKLGDALNIVDRQAQSDLDKFKTFIEKRHDATGAWRGEIEGRTAGTPGVESATSHGDSGKAGISGKAAVAGVAAVAAGAAAFAATRSGSEEESDTTAQTQTPHVSPAPPVEEIMPLDLTAPVGDTTAVSADSAGRGDLGLDDPRVAGDDLATEATTPGVSDENDGRPPLGTV